LAAAGARDSILPTLQGHSLIAAGALFACAVLLLMLYQFALPIVATVVAARIPSSVASRISNEVMRSLDETVFTPSMLPLQRQQEIARLFDTLTLPDRRPVRPDIVFRASTMGANAFSLPSGIIIVTDDLVMLTEDPREIAAVLAHELGHLHHRHGLRRLVQASVLGIVVSAWYGDLSSVVTLPTLIVLDAQYSREFEIQADAYAAEMLRSNGLDPELLGVMLDKLQRDHCERQQTDCAQRLEFLSSHPPVPRRRMELHAR